VHGVERRVFFGVFRFSEEGKEEEEEEETGVVVGRRRRRDWGGSSLRPLVCFYAKRMI
jgi:hypothetical protein